MTSARKRRGKVVEAQTEHNVGIDGDGLMRATKRTSGRRHKATGKTDDYSAENDENCSPSSSALAKCPVRGTCLMKTATKSPVFDLYPGKILHPSAKIKLQLFPIDEKTRMGLEKDGFHPYLELTLSTRKKISSVLKHLNCKWGSSSIALGEPMLLPYNTLENLASYRWTTNDNDISAGDVYAAIGNPTVFRLRYGWLSNLKTEAIGVPSTTTSLEGCLKAEGLQKSCSTNMENTNGKVKQMDAAREELEPIIESGSTNTGFAEKMSFDGPVGSMDNEVRTDGSIGQPSLLWDDMLTNISIGGLLSEASFQGEFSSEMKSNGSNAGLQPSQLISDSFDAFLAAQMNHPQGPQPAPQQPRSSILDAEDTCHEFAFQKFSSSWKDTLGLGGNIFCSQGAEAEKFKAPTGTEENIQSGLQPSNTSKKSETDLLLSSRLLNDESSLGLSDIKWTDSLGPFDLGLASSRSGFVN